MAARKVLASTQSRLGLLRPVSWFLFWWLVFHHAPGWAPSWASPVVYTILGVAAFVLIVDWFSCKQHELVFKEDGSVKWKEP